jgi:hypothetical protein
MDKIDKIKENLGVTKLDEKTRKELFEKFVEGGGKVVDEKNRKLRLNVDKDKQNNLSKKPRRYPDPGPRKEAPKARNVKAVSPLRPVPSDDFVSLMNFFSSLKLRFRLKLRGITGFDGRYFNNKFFNKFNIIYKSALIEIQILYFELFRKNPPAGRDLTDKLDEMKPQYFELIEMAGNIFDKILSDQILEQYANFPELPKRVSELREPILRLMKKIYVLSRYENTILYAFERAIDLYGKSGEILSESPSAAKKKMRNDIFVVFHKLLPRLHLLFCLYHGRNFLEYDPDIEALLAVADSEKPGKRVLDSYFESVSAPAKEGAKGETPTEEPEEDEGSLFKGIRKGLEIMSMLDMSKLRSDYERKGLFGDASGVDKVIIAYLLFNEFDKEYSCVLTTNKIKYRKDYITRTHGDHKAGLVGLYDKMKQSVDSLKEYAEELKGYEKAKKEKPLSNAQYIEYTKRLEALEKKKNVVGKNTLTTVRAYMNEVAQELNVLVEDMDSQQEHIDNPQEALVFDPLLEGEKKINNKKIYEAIYIVHCYASAFAYRLSPGGDLSGDIEFKKDELETVLKKKAEAPAETKKEEPGPAKPKSVLEELDDLL